MNYRAHWFVLHLSIFNSMDAYDFVHWTSVNETHYYSNDALFRYLIYTKLVKGELYRRQKWECKILRTHQEYTIHTKHCRIVALFCWQPLPFVAVLSYRIDWCNSQLCFPDFITLDRLVLLPPPPPPPPKKQSYTRVMARANFKSIEYLLFAWCFLSHEQFAPVSHKMHQQQHHCEISIASHCHICISVWCCIIFHIPLDSFSVYNGIQCWIVCEHKITTDINCRLTTAQHQKSTKNRGNTLGFRIFVIPSVVYDLVATLNQGTLSIVRCMLLGTRLVTSIVSTFPSDYAE